MCARRTERYHRYTDADVSETAPYPKAYRYPYP